MWWSILYRNWGSQSVRYRLLALISSAIQNPCTCTTPFFCINCSLRAVRTINVDHCWPRSFYFHRPTTHPSHVSSLMANRAYAGRCNTACKKSSRKTSSNSLTTSASLTTRKNLLLLCNIFMQITVLNFLSVFALHLCTHKFLSDEKFRCRVNK